MVVANPVPRVQFAVCLLVNLKTVALKRFWNTVYPFIVRSVVLSHYLIHLFHHSRPIVIPKYSIFPIWLHVLFGPIFKKLQMEIIVGIIKPSRANVFAH